MSLLRVAATQMACSWDLPAILERAEKLIREPSAVAPFKYASLPFALLVGFYLWGDWPDWISFIGSGLIIFSGLLVAYLENRASKKLLQHAQIDY